MRVFRVVVMPALAMLTVCCSMTCTQKVLAQSEPGCRQPLVPLPGVCEVHAAVAVVPALATATKRRSY